MGSSLSRRLFFLMLVAMLPLAAILFYNLYAIRASKQKEVHAEAFQLGQLASLEMQRILSGLENTLVAVSAAPAVQNHDLIACNRYMMRVGGRLPQFAGIAVLDTSGVIKCRQEPAGIGVSLVDKDYFKQALAGRFAVGEYGIGRVSGVKVLPVAVPITDDNGKIIGVVAGSLDLNWLGRRLRERSFALNSTVTIADREGIILAHYPDPDKFVGKRIADDFMTIVKAQAPGTTEVTSQDGTRRVLAYFPPSDLQPGLYVSSGFSTAEEYASILKAMYYGVAVTLIAILAAFLLASLAGKYAIRRPFDRLLSTVEAWRHDDESARTGMTRDGGEFGRLGKAIDSYMDELVASRNQRRLDEEQRELLIGELDHRVKNLLATVQAVARQSFKAVDVDPKAIDVFTRRLAAMGDAHSLLMKGEWQSASISAVVATAIQPFEAANSSQFVVSGPEFTLQSKVALALSMALHELCTNAAKYGALSDERGRVHIDWSVDGNAQDARLIFAWTETNGPAVVPPARSGFGTTMIERMLGSQTGAEVETQYRSDGLKFKMTVPLEGILASR